MSESRLRTNDGVYVLLVEAVPENGCHLDDQDVAGAAFRC